MFTSKRVLGILTYPRVCPLANVFHVYLLTLVYVHKQTCSRYTYLPSCMFTSKRVPGILTYPRVCPLASNYELVHMTHNTYNICDLSQYLYAKNRQIILYQDIILYGVARCIEREGECGLTGTYRRHENNVRIIDCGELRPPLQTKKIIINFCLMCHYHIFSEYS